MGEEDFEDPQPLRRVLAEVVAATMIVATGQVFYYLLFPVKPTSPLDAALATLVFVTLAWWAIRRSHWLRTPSPPPIEARLIRVARLTHEAAKAMVGIEREIEALGVKQAQLQELLKIHPETANAVRELLAPIVTRQNRRNLWYGIIAAATLSIPPALVAIALSIPAAQRVFASWFPTWFAPP